jgi:hypothetical protein
MNVFPKGMRNHTRHILLMIANTFRSLNRVNNREGRVTQGHWHRAVLEQGEMEL